MYKLLGKSYFILGKTILLVFALVSCDLTCKDEDAQNPELNYVEQILLTSKIKVRDELQKIDTCVLSESDMYHYRLLSAICSVSFTGNFPQNYDNEKMYIHFKNQNNCKYANLALLTQARYYFAHQDYENALKIYNRLMLFYEEYNPNDIYLGMVYINMGFCYSYLEFLPTAIQYYQKSLPVLYKHPESPGICNVYSQLGSIKMKLGADTAECIAYLDSAMYWAKVYDFMPTYYFSENHKIRLTQPIDSIALIKNTKILCNEYKNYGSASIVAHYYIEHCRFDSARHYIEIVKKSSKPDDIKEREQLEIRLAKKEQRKFDYDSLLFNYVKKYTDVKQSAIKEEILLQTQQTEYNRRENEIINLKVERLRILVIGIIVLLLLLIVIALVILLYNKTKKNLNDKIELKDNIITQKDRERQDSIKQQTDALADLKIGVKTERRSGKDDMFSNMWETYRKDFNAAHNQIFDKLNAIVKITNLEEKIIYLSYFNYSVEKMATLLGKEYRTIYNYRYNIAKKLGCTTRELASYLRKVENRKEVQ